MMLIIGKITVGNSENYNVDNLERYMSSYLSELQLDVNSVLTQ